MDCVVIVVLPVSTNDSDRLWSDVPGQTLTHELAEFEEICGCAAIFRRNGVE